MADLPQQTQYKPYMGGRTNIPKAGAVAPRMQAPAQAPAQAPVKPKYKSYSDAIGRGLQLAQNVGKTLPQPRSRKAVDVGQFQGVADTTKSLAERIGGLGKITTPYLGSTKFEPSGTHLGIDIANKSGTTVPSFTPGKVAQVGKSPSYGNYVMVRDSQNNMHRYSHLSNSWVQVNQEVGRGTPIGAMGKSGNVYSTRPDGDPSHLDYRVRDLYQRYISPYQFI